MSGRLQEMRDGLFKKLQERKTPHNWQHIVDQIGMIAFTGLSKEQVNELREKHSIYLTLDGRISIAGLNTHNLDQVADAFHLVTKDKKF